MILEGILTYIRGNEFLECINDRDIQIAMGLYEPPKSKKGIKTYIKKKIWQRKHLA